MLKDTFVPEDSPVSINFNHLAQHLSYFLIHKGIHLLSYCGVISTAKLCWLSLDSACFYFWADKNCSGPPSLGLCGGNRTFPLSPSHLSLSACSVGDLGLIPGLGGSAGEGIGYLLQYSWASLVAQLVKNPPAMRETWVRSLGWNDPWRSERLPTPVIWPGEFHGLDYTVHGVTKSQA